MRSERGQATVEWIGMVLLVALALAALGRFAPGADGHGLGATLAHSVTCAARDGCQAGRVPSSHHAAAGGPRGVQKAFTAPPLVPHPDHHQARRGLRLPSFRTLFESGRREVAERVGRAGGRALAERLRRGGGLAWRRAWIACLIYERARYAFLHPESRFPGYTIPLSEVLRMSNDCISPFDLVRDWQALRSR